MSKVFETENKERKFRNITEDDIIRNKQIIKLTLINVIVLITMLPFFYVVIVSFIQYWTSNAELPMFTQILISVIILVASLIIIAILSYTLAKRRYNIFMNADPSSRLSVKIKYLYSIRPKIIHILISFLIVALLFASEEVTKTIAFIGLYMNLFCWEIYFLSKGYQYRCRNCKCMYLLKHVTTSHTGSEDISIKVQNKVKNSNGTVRWHVDQYIPGERKFYTQEHRCKWCGGLHTSYYSKDVKLV